jgi:hypothetical protein
MSNNFFKKKKQEIKVNENTIELGDKLSFPQIIYFNVRDEDKNALNSFPYNIDFRSYGHKVKLENQPGYGSYCLVNHNIPKNVHEYDIFIFDMCNEIIKDYNQEEHQRTRIPTEDESYIFCSHPQNIFDPIPLSGIELKPILLKKSEKPSILILFAGQRQEVKYDFAHKTKQGAHTFNTGTLSNYSFFPINFPFYQNKYGKSFIFNDTIKGTVIGNILYKYIKSSEYHIVFYQMTVRPDRGYQKINDKRFLPFFFNSDNEIIAFGYLNKKQWILVLPDIKDKAGIISDLITEYCPAITPELFPDNQIHAWKNEEKYFLPKHRELIIQKSDIEKEYHEKTNELDKKIEENKQCYAFLHDILTETGEKLVIAVIKYLEYLGFDTVKNMDEIQPQKKEEDIQILLKEGLVILEVKGIGGKPSDSDCSQISKIRHRRCKERSDFNVDAICLINHQRHIPPSEREKNPFTIDQINDAQSDDRSLLTTLELYKIYPLLENGLINKDDVRRAFTRKGLIDFIDGLLTELGIAEEVYKDGYVTILNLSNNDISKGDMLITEYHGNYQIAMIESIQVADQDTEYASNCEVGIKLNVRVKPKTRFYKNNRETTSGNNT